MKVKDLIKILQELDQEKEIIALDYDYECTAMYNHFSEAIHSDDLEESTKENITEYYQGEPDVYVLK